MDVGFVILLPDRNVAALRNTLWSIESYGYKRESVCAVGNDVQDEELKNLKQYCQTFKGDDTITSLINLGMKKLNQEWGFIMFGGSRIPQYIEKKFSYFCQKESDILFPVVDRKMNFVEGSFNGVMINKKFFKEVGDFPTTDMQKQGYNDFEMAKMFWALDAIDHGATFKAMVGMRII